MCNKHSDIYACFRHFFYKSIYVIRKVLVYELLHTTAGYTESVSGFACKTSSDKTFILSIKKEKKVMCHFYPLKVNLLKTLLDAGRQALFLHCSKLPS